MKFTFFSLAIFAGLVLLSGSSPEGMRCQSPEAPPTACEDLLSEPRDFYYDAREFHYEFDVSTESVQVLFDEALSSEERDAIVASVDRLEAVSAKQVLTPPEYEIPLTPCTTRAQIMGVVAQLNATVGVEWAIPMYVSRGDEESKFYTYGILEVTFPLTFPDEEADVLASLLVLEITSIHEQPWANSKSYTCRVTEDSPLTVVEYLKAFQRHPECLDVAPGFLGYVTEEP